MNYDFFKVQMLRLQENFGRAKYSPDRIRIFWEKVKDVDATAFQGWIDTKIANSNNAPLGGDFDEFTAKQKRNKSITSDTLEKMKKGLLCEYCDNGLVLSIHLASKTNTAFLCPYCDYAKDHNLYNNYKKNIGRGVPFWSDDYLHKYSKPIKLFDVLSQKYKAEQIEKSM